MKVTKTDALIVDPGAGCIDDLDQFGVGLVGEVWIISDAVPDEIYALLAISSVWVGDVCMGVDLAFSGGGGRSLGGEAVVGSCEK